MSLNKFQSMMKVQPAKLNRKCSDCGNDIPKGTYCLAVTIGDKKRSFCVDCVYINGMKLLQHFNVQELQDKHFELALTEQ